MHFVGRRILDVWFVFFQGDLRTRQFAPDVGRVVESGNEFLAEEGRCEIVSVPSFDDGPKHTVVAVVLDGNQIAPPIRGDDEISGWIQLQAVGALGS